MEDSTFRNRCILKEGDIKFIRLQKKINKFVITRNSDSCLGLKKLR